MLSDTTSASQLQEQALIVDITLMEGLSPRDYAAAASWLPTKATYWTETKTCKYRAQVYKYQTPLKQ